MKYLLKFCTKLFPLERYNFIYSSSNGSSMQLCIHKVVLWWCTVCENNSGRVWRLIYYCWIFDVTQFVILLRRFTILWIYPQNALWKWYLITVVHQCTNITSAPLCVPRIGATTWTMTGTLAKGNHASAQIYYAFCSFLALSRSWTWIAIGHALVWTYQRKELFTT